MAETISQSQLAYPPAPRQDEPETPHGVPVADPYRWLEDLDAPQTREWIEAEDALTFGFLEKIPARESIRVRLEALWDYEKFGVPTKRGERYFFARQAGLQNQAVLYWLDTLDGEPRLLLDPNTLSADGTIALTGYNLSRDGRRLAYGLSAAGSDWQEWRVRDVDTGQDLDDQLNWVKFSGASWTADGAGFYYSRYDPPAAGATYKGANYHQKLYYHRIGTAQTDDELVYARPDQKEWGFGGEVTEDARYLIISVWKGTHRENGIFYKDLLAPDAPTVELLVDFDAHYGFIGNDGPVFYFLTDRDAPRLRVIAIDVTNPAPGEWRTLIPESADALQDAGLVGDVFIASYLHDAHSSVRVFALDGQPAGEVALPGLGTASGFRGRRADRETFYFFTSFSTPGTVYRYDLDAGASTVFRAPQLRFDPADYVTEQFFYPSKDGTHIPLFVSHKKGLVPDGDAPTYLYGYGGFNIPMTPAFAINVLVWMEMGGIFAQPCLRGGGEYGKPWHEAGMKRHKQNVFDDFIAAAEWLIANGYTRTPRLAIGGGSNGGLLVGACLTQRPDLFGACAISVGVLDMLRFHKFTIGWAWVSDYGSPDDPDDFRTLLAYSPYHNLKPGTAYPPTLIKTGDHDDRVYPAHSFKFAAALQAAQSGPAPVLIRIDVRAGHGLGKPTAKLIDEAADTWAFLVRALGMENGA